ncbi:MAG: hypothetical protein RBR43_10330 [Desulfuromonadaceae bacterium]|nr:hypothetical protein [Desulfuromonadaceae bacterium]
MRYSKLYVCVQNNGYAASLEQRKIYQALPDNDASQIGMVRIIDESGEDYLYPEECFAQISLPAEIRQELKLAA